MQAGEARLAASFEQSAAPPHAAAASRGHDAAAPIPRSAKARENGGPAQRVLRRHELGLHDAADGDGDQTSWLGCVMGCMERPPEDENERKPSQAAGDLLARAETEERRAPRGLLRIIQKGITFRSSQRHSPQQFRLPLLDAYP